MRFFVFTQLFCFLAFLATGCGESPATLPTTREQLVKMRADFHTQLLRKDSDPGRPPIPPKALLRLVPFPAKVGNLWAYVSPDPGDNRKHPAIIWIFGGFSNGIGEPAWEDGPADNDQSASAFRKAGICMMYPSRRGAEGNPGFKEGLFGEVDDVVSAMDFLRQLPWIDKDRIYLGGHSTGGTLALLVAEVDNRFRSVFAFGAVHTTIGYGADALPFNVEDRKEAIMRAPLAFLSTIENPVFAIEGTQGNHQSLVLMKKYNKNPKVQFLSVEGSNHFRLLRPCCELLAKKIMADGASSSGITLTEEELVKAVGQ